MYSGGTFTRPRPQTAVLPEIFAISWHALDPALDTHRHKGKNTHELIVLPAIRQVLPADLALWHWPLAGRHALASRQRSSLLSANGQSRFPRQQDLSWRGGYPSEPWPRDLELAFEPDQNIHGRQDAKRLPEDLTAR